MKTMGLLIAMGMTSLVVLAGCNAKEQDDLARAQACLDKVDQNDPTTADECLQYIEKYDSQQASILKCGIYMTSGGPFENKIVKAYAALKDDESANKTAIYMAYLSLDKPDLDQAYQKANTGNKHCQRSGVPGLQYLGSMIVAGTAFNLAIKNLSGAGIDPNDPAAAAAAVQNLLDTCTGANPPASCTQNVAAVGEAATSLAGQYCSNSNADQDVCASINGATQAADGDPAKVGQAMYCFLKNLNYDPATNVCK